MAVIQSPLPQQASGKEYKRRIWAWTMYDWANSAFATTIMAAVLPVYYSQVAGATLPSPATATAYWTTGLSLSTLIVAILSPVLGTISDVIRGKKRFLSFFCGLGILGTGLLVLVNTGDWMLASLLFIFGRIGFNAANVFYDALLPHVARSEDLDMISTRGYAMGYLGGGILLAVNVAMIFFLPGTWGARLSFLSVAVWWAVFSIPLFRWVPEPPAASVRLARGETVVGVSLRRLRDTFRDIRQYKELFKFVIAFLIYVDGIGTIIEIATIYGAELGFASTELILALLMVQFVGIPYSLIFGRLPNPAEKRRPFFVAFVLFNLVALPVLGIGGRLALPASLAGTPPAPYQTTGDGIGQGAYLGDDPAIRYAGEWTAYPVPETARSEYPQAYLSSVIPGDAVSLAFNGQRIKVTYGTGPDFGDWAVWLDGQPYRDAEKGEPLVIQANAATLRVDQLLEIRADTAGPHILSLVNQSTANASATRMAIARFEVLPPERKSNLGMILGAVVGVELLGLILAFLLGPRFFTGLAAMLDTRRSILLALLVYAVISVWGFFLNSVIEYWCLAWMVATVQGGSQALSRSLFSTIAPASKSGEFFGLFGIMEKFSAILGPLVFALTATIFGSSRPAILSIIIFFVVGGYLLTRVNIDEGQRLARQEDAKYAAEKVVE
jgi:UMF1 family MFS transporter